MTALVVDDSRLVRMILCGILSDLGFNVLQATNGREAIESMNQNHSPAVVFVDSNMPLMDGLEFTIAIRRDAKHVGLPLVMITSESDMEFISKALEAGIDEYIVKPFDREVICTKLNVLGICVGELSCPSESL